MEAKNKPSLSQFKKNVVMHHYIFVVDGYNGDRDEDWWELIFVDAESLDVARVKAKEKAVMYGYKRDPDYVGIVMPPSVGEET